MNIAFHSPLKPPDHPVPSGDRLMARLILAALSRARHAVTIATTFRSFSASSDRDPGLAAQAAGERERIAALWAREGRPDLWFCYHPYYKAPDLLGPELCGSFGVPYVTAEASYSARRNIGGWAEQQAQMMTALRQAAVNICFTKRDFDGLAAADPNLRLAMLTPFIDPALLLETVPDPQPFRLITVAMMRPGDKLDSYRALAEALALLADQPWTLSVVGDGPASGEVHRLFSRFGPERIVWHGRQSPEEIAGLLSKSALYVWPGCGEAYGLAYLEAQAAGVPVVAYRTAGVPEVVDDGRTGVLVADGDPQALAGAIHRLLSDEQERREMAETARQTVVEARSIGSAASRLDAILRDFMRMDR